MNNFDYESRYISGIKRMVCFTGQTYSPDLSDLTQHHSAIPYRLAELRNQLLGSDVLLEVWVRFATTEISLRERYFWVILYNDKQASKP